LLVLEQPVAKAPTPSTSLPAISSGESLFSNITATTSTPSLTPASTSLLGTAPTTSTSALTSGTAATPLATLTTATSTSASTLAATAAVTTPTLSVHGLEEKVNKWVAEIREQEERLMRQAAHVNSWDQLLQQGHDQVQQLRDTLNKVKMDQQSLQAELDFIQGQQQELEQLIEPLEAAVASTTPAQHQGDRQRDNMHHLAQNLDAQLHQMTDDLCKVIEHLNSNNVGSQATDPVNTVARVLSAHMDTLKWVDQNSALLTQKIEDLSRAADSKRRD
ncbi:nuclear pore glycoprotein p62-like, partial [Macrobrachium nipponense]|uniref:nuclear pore glycoprotein p62-like n=1 Tax=Macrobrachium nipponense TaxID=159736 RepID=UPI0030C7E4D1